MKTTLVLGAVLVGAFAVSLAESWYLAVVLEFLGFVAWCQVHHVLTKRERVAAFGPTEEDQ
jgi:hypothetical protein